jgi:pantetheine-phosphate adenylyltransferase
VTEQYRKRIAVYPGSFDPVTNGHVDIAVRAASLMDLLIVAVYETPAKNLLFTTDERVALWQEVIAERHITNIEVDRYSGLTVDYVRSVGGQSIVRGLRATTDFEVEFQQALMYRKLAPEIEVLCMITDLQYLFVSSSLLKEVARLGAPIEDMVPAPVARALRAKFDQ